MKYLNLGVHQILAEATQFSPFTNTFQLALQASTSIVSKPDEMRSLAQEWRKSFPDATLICHMPFTTNLVEESKYTQEMIIENIKVCEEYNIKSIVIHPGKYHLHDKNKTVPNVVRQLESVFNTISSDKVSILLENQPHYNTLSLDDLIYISDTLPNTGICLDTCHAWGAGYSDREITYYLEKDEVKAIHLNSVPKGTICGSSSDEHTHLSLQDSYCLSPEWLISIITKYPDKIKIMEQRTEYAIKSFRYLEKIIGNRK